MSQGVDMQSWLKYFLWLFALCWFNTIPCWAQEPITNPLGQEIPGSTFIRYGKQSIINQNCQNNVNTNASIDTISAGFSLSF